MEERLNISNEAMRLLALKDLHILDTASEQDFDDITRLATQICDVPVSLVTFIDEDRQWFKSKTGLGINEIPLDVSFCADTILQSGITMVHDTFKDERHANNVMVAGEPFVRFYAGVPLVTKEGFAVGTLCIMDTRPRSLTTDQIFGLKVLARHVYLLFEMRRLLMAGKLPKEKMEAFHAQPRHAFERVLRDADFEKGSKEDLPVKQIFSMDRDMLLDKKILVVDDNRINRLMAATILRNFGAVTSEAANGQEAIDVLSAKEIDLVLMDIQMPVMDGMEATGIIREKISRSLPIIALTANAIKGDNKKCMDAGMNEYLTKPFKEKELLEIVAFWLNKTAKVQVGEAPVKVAATQVYDLSGLHQISRGNAGFVEKMVVMFMTQTPLLVAEMEEKFLAGNYVEMGIIAHKIKPVIDNMGIATLKDTIREIEKKGKQPIQDESVPALLKTVKTIIEIAVDSLMNDFGTNVK